MLEHTHTHTNNFSSRNPAEPLDHCQRTVVRPARHAVGCYRQRVDAVLIVTCEKVRGLGGLRVLRGKVPLEQAAILCGASV